MVCDTDDEFPQASVKVQVRTMVYEPAHWPGVVTSTPSTVISAPQLSVAVSETIAGTSEAQATVMVAGAAGATGAMLSLTLMFCETEVVFPHASVKVQVRTMVNEFGQLPGVVVSTPSATIAPEQLSAAVRVMVAGTSEAQATVTAAGAEGATGAVTSCTVKVAEVVAVFPQASVAVKTTVMAAEQSFESASKSLVQVTSEQASVATAPPLLASQALMPFWLPDPSHSTVRF